MPTKSAAKKSTRSSAAKKVAKKTTKKSTKTTKQATPKKAAKRVAKKTAKKAGGTKRTSKRNTKEKKPLIYAENDTSFWVTNGEILNSLVALRDALAAMEKEVYLYHATGGQNDFAVWVESVLCDPNCAADLTVAKSPRSAKTVVVRHLKTYEI